MQAVVLAGGRGLRLAGDAQPPKPLTPLNGLPVLDHILGQLAHHGVTEALVLTGWRAAEIAAALGDGARHGLRVRCVAESAPLGTAGAVRAARELLHDRFVVAYGDLIFDLDLSAMLRAHLAAGALATLAVHPNDHPFDSDRVVTDSRGRVLRLVRPSEHAGAAVGALCNAAFYVVERAALSALPDDGAAYDFAHDLFPRLLAAGERLHAWRTAEYVKDMGTVERSARIAADLAAAVPARLRRAALKPALLCDRDGVLIEDRPYVTDAAELRLLPSAAPSLQRLNRARVLTALCTNQPVVARGQLDEEGLHALHRHLEGLLGAGGGWLDGLFVCPHHPDRGFAGERTDLKIRCDCRKPLPGLVFQAEAALGIDRRASVFVGDRTSDLVCARDAGVLGIGVLSGSGLRDGRHAIAAETPIVPSLAEATALMLDTAPSFGPFVESARAAGVVCIGGPSRAGKTLAAAALRLALQSAGAEVVHVSLDRFLQPAAERRPGSTLRERTQFAAAQIALTALCAGRSVLLPGYDPLTRARGASAIFSRGAGRVLVVDGLLANALALPGALEWAFDAPADLRRERRDAFYRWKGLDGEQLARAVAGPALAEEELEVAAAMGRAHTRFRLSPTLTVEEIA